MVSRQFELDNKAYYFHYIGLHFSQRRRARGSICAETKTLPSEERWPANRVLL